MMIRMIIVVTRTLIPCILLAPDHLYSLFDVEGSILYYGAIDIHSSIQSFSIGLHLPILIFSCISQHILTQPGCP